MVFRRAAGLEGLQGHRYQKEQEATRGANKKLYERHKPLGTGIECGAFGRNRASVAPSTQRAARTLLDRTKAGCTTAACESWRPWRHEIVRSLWCVCVCVCVHSFVEKRPSVWSRWSRTGHCTGHLFASSVSTGPTPADGTARAVKRGHWAKKNSQIIPAIG